MHPTHADLGYQGYAPYFPIVGGFRPENRALGFVALIPEFQRRERTGFGKPIDANIAKFEGGSGTDAEVAPFPVVASSDQHIGIRPFRASARASLERCPIRVISIGTSTPSHVQIEPVGKSRSIETDRSSIDSDVATPVEIDICVGIAAVQTNHEVRS